MTLVSNRFWLVYVIYKCSLYYKCCVPLGSNLVLCFCSTAGFLRVNKSHLHIVKWASRSFKVCWFIFAMGKLTLMVKAWCFDPSVQTDLQPTWTLPPDFFPDSWSLSKILGKKSTEMTFGTSLKSFELKLDWGCFTWLSGFIENTVFTRLRPSEPSVSKLWTASVTFKFPASNVW